MNKSRIEMILQQNSMRSKLNSLEFRPLKQPEVVQNTANAFLSSNPFFYSFDGRTVNFLRSENTPSSCSVGENLFKSPVTSVDDYIKSLALKRMNGVTYCFTLSSKNKLEYFPESLTEKRFIIGRSVLKMIRTRDTISNNIIYFLATKDSKYFIHEVAYESSRFIGKICVQPFEAEKADIFPTSRGMFYSIDGNIYDMKGESLNYKGTFVDCNRDLVVVGRNNPGIYEFDLLTSAFYEKLDSVTIPVISLPEVKMLSKYVILRDNKTFYLIGFDNNKIEVLGSKNVDYDVEIFDPEFVDGAIIINLIKKDSITEKNEKPEIRNPFANLSFSLESLKQNLEKSTELSHDYATADSSAEMAKVIDEKSQENSIKKDVSIVESSTDLEIAVPDTKTENVMTESKNTSELNKKSTKGKSKSFSKKEATNALVDEVKQKFKSDVSSDKKSNKVSTNDRFSNYYKIKAEESSEQPKKNFDTKNIQSIVENAIDKKFNEVMSGDYKQFIKNIIFETIVPSFEVAFAEMKVQILAELRDMKNPNQRIRNTVMDLIRKNEIDEAIIASVNSNDILGCYDLFTLDFIYEASSSALIDLLNSVTTALKDSTGNGHKGPIEINPSRLSEFICCVLSCIEPDELSVEGIQLLSSSLNEVKNCDFLRMYKDRINAQCLSTSARIKKSNRKRREIK